MSDGAGAVTFGPIFIRTSRLSARIRFFHLLGEGKAVDAVHPASDRAPLVAHTLDAFAAAAARMFAHTVSQGVMLSTCIFCGQCFVSVIAFEPECVEKRTMARPERDLASVGQSTCLAACGMVELERRKSRNGCKPHAWFYNMGACVNATPSRLVCWWTNRFRSTDSVRQRLHGLCARSINAVSAISREGRERVSAGGFGSSAQTASRKGRTSGGSCILAKEISPSILD